MGFAKAPLIQRERAYFISPMSPGGAVEQIAEWQQHMLALFSPATWHLSHARSASAHSKGLSLSSSTQHMEITPAANTDYSMSDP